IAPEGVYSVFGSYVLDESKGEKERGRKTMLGSYSIEFRHWDSERERFVELFDLDSDLGNFLRNFGEAYGVPDPIELPRKVKKSGDSEEAAVESGRPDFSYFSGRVKIPIPA
ncbi:MAG: hypothetical protein MI922_10420, partial [Bacteroidales bacterium]|nr:hypothetical protein [Bacteroidales bacterium]